MTPVPSYPAPTLVGVNINSPARAQSSAGPDTGDGGSGASKHANRTPGLLARGSRLDAARCVENAPRGVADAGQPKTGTASPATATDVAGHSGVGGSLMLRAGLWAPGTYRQPPQGSAMNVRHAPSRGNGQGTRNTKEAA